MGQPRRRTAGGRGGERICRAAGGAVEKGARRVGRGRRAHRAAEGCGGLRDLYARERSGPAGIDRENAGSSGRRRRGRGAARSGDDDREQPARPARPRRRPGAQPRSHPSLHHRADGLEPRAGPRPRGADPADSGAAGGARRRDRPRVVLPGQGAFRPGDVAQQPARVAWLRRVDGGRAARRESAALHGRRQAARLDLLDRAPRRRGADVLRVAAPQPDRRVDAPAEWHDELARARLHGRDLRLLPACRKPAIQAAAAHAAQAGARLRRWHRPGHAEPGGPRLQGALERRDVVPRPPADRTRQGAGDRGAGGRVGIGRADRSTAGRWSRPSPAWAAASS